MDRKELQKSASSNLKLSAKTVADIAEKLYAAGFISYPRTETNTFSECFDFKSLIKQHVDDPNWGGMNLSLTRFHEKRFFISFVKDFAQNLLQKEKIIPSDGKNSDFAHPPIYPILHTNTLTVCP